MKLDTTNDHQDMDYDHHIQTYTRFVRATIGGIAALVILFAGLAFSLL